MADAPSHHLVFVYGTLRRGQHNNQFLLQRDIGKSEFIGAATTLEKFPLVLATSYNLPFLLDARGSGHVGIKLSYSLKLHYT